MSNKITKTSHSNISDRNEAGFTMIEAIVAIFILTVGLIGTAAAITYALQFSSISQNVTRSKLAVIASFEEIESLRNSRRLDYKQISNAGAVNNTGVPNPFNGFSVGFKPVSINPGPDGVNGTDDDLTTGPGPDGIYGTADDITDPSQALAGYSRRITITDISTTIKKVEVKIRYPGRGGATGEITGICYVNDEARITR